MNNLRTVLTILASFFFASISYAVEPGMIHLCVQTNGKVQIDNASDTCPSGNESMYMQKAIPGQRVAMGVLGFAEAEDEVSPPTDSSGGPIPGLTKTIVTSTTGCVTAQVRLEVLGYSYVSVFLDGVAMRGQNHVVNGISVLDPAVLYTNGGSFSVDEKTFWLCNLAPGTHVVEVRWNAFNSVEQVQQRSLFIQGW